MDIEVKVDKEAVERAVATAIIQSTIGDKISEVVTKLMKDAMEPAGYNKAPGILHSVVVTQATEICRKVFVEEYSDKVREMVREKITDELVQKIIDKTWQVWIEKSERW